MRTATTALALAFSGFVSAQADIPEKYQTIVDRNPFALNAPVLLDPVIAEAPLPPANVMLTGFTRVNGQKKAYFTTSPKDLAKEPQHYIGLEEGDRYDALELIHISEEEGEVRIKSGGVEMVLTLNNNGFKPRSIASAPSVP